MIINIYIYISFFCWYICIKDVFKCKHDVWRIIQGKRRYSFQSVVWSTRLQVSGHSKSSTSCAGLGEGTGDSEAEETADNDDVDAMDDVEALRLSWSADCWCWTTGGMDMALLSGLLLGRNNESWLCWLLLLVRRKCWWLCGERGFKMLVDGGSMFSSSFLRMRLLLQSA